MRNCPKCGADVFPGASDCPSCGALFTADGAIVQAGGGHKADGAAARPYEPGKLAWANLSLSIAFASAFFWSPGTRLVSALIEPPILQTIPPYLGNSLVSLLNYCLVSALVYAGLRLAGAERWLRLRPGINTLLAIGNILLFVFVAARVLASSVEGGGATFVVLSYSPIFILPARVLFLAGLVWLVVHSLRARDRPPPGRQPFSAGEYVGIAFVISTPIVFASTLYIGETAPLRLVREAQARMAEQCASAGERIHLRPSVKVRGVFVEHDREDAFINVREGRYEDSTNQGGELLGGLVGLGVLDFYERPFGARTFGDSAEFKYRRYRRGDSRAAGTNDAESQFGVFHKDLSNDRDRKLGIRGTELTVTDLRTGDVLATTTYFVSTRDRRFCGHAPDGVFSTREFAIRALELK
jgi:hypothetical protein